MKRFTCSLLSIIFLTINSLAGTSEQKSGPAFVVTKTVRDSSLGKSESKIVFHFSTRYGTADGDSDSVPDPHIKMSYNGVNKTILPDAQMTYPLLLKPGKYVFRFFANARFYEITTDSIPLKAGHRSEAEVYFTASGTAVICDKPVIYVYPDKTEAISIRLDLKGNLDFTYPRYENGWQFTADPNGTIHMNGREYDYLFWDGSTTIATAKTDWKTGFAVKKEELETFFEEKLTAMGLSPREIQDYITYWCPRMRVNELNYVHFLFNETYNDYAALSVEPKPDNQFRVFMIWSKLETGSQPALQAQPIPSFKREGFTLVEWGGAEMNTLEKIVQ